MAKNRLSTQIGRPITLPGRFDLPVLLEDVRALGADGSAGYECRIRLPDGIFKEGVIQRRGNVFGRLRSFLASQCGRRAVG